MAERTPERTSPGAPAVRFEATLLTIADRPIVKLPKEASAQLPSRGQVAVTGILNRQAFETVLEPDGMRGHWLQVDKNVRQAVALSVGDTVEVELHVSKAWPEPEMPKDFQEALAGAPDVSELWRDITPMARWEWVRWINATKNVQTRQRRVEVGLLKLRSGKRRPCCFDLASCTDPELSKNGKLIDAV
ncbi:YdeI/OmpD-associated family protein [Cryobacterium psychrophilum]|uniref:DUF1905 domain-containing protein n=1 Tax=Cryobacterium psychrophilum TaxID=41988 RepID=A0A4Y8KNX9_9MICO|nr:YdeI/OmpD-associated family protein [Cryobacterium psychrophilum]TDW30770.1 bacteriocin resistance YdeI/OmpD-like protein [Cryobacterium psychrophilum]TFD75828.1 DUF1905 domain-containing protein [Cryobacterium psychrophilum]